MEKRDDQIHTGDELKNLPVQTEDIAFKPEEMIPCGKCARVNPPNRLKCFYCGATLEITAEQAANIKPTLRKLESWEKGYNLIYAPVSNIENEFDLTGTAKILNLEIEDLQKILQAKKTLPVARAESDKEAEIVAKKLREQGFNISIISDETLAADKLPTRLRSLDFESDRIVLIYFNTDEIAEIRRENLILIVSGALYERKTESIEKRKKGESKILDASETASDESLIDIYSRDNSNGYRVLAKGFDFSCLETGKGILAVENMRKLAEKLREFAPGAKFVDDYPTVREALGNVWEIEQKKDALGLKRHSFGKFDFSNVATSNNLQQFTKYSRLQRQIL
jgi:predicted CoA-binding protein